MAVEMLVHCCLGDESRAASVCSIPSVIDLDPCLVFRRDMQQSVIGFTNYVLGYLEP